MLFKPLNLSRPWDHHSLGDNTGVEWRALPPSFAFSTTKLPPEQIAIIHYISIRPPSSKTQEMQKAGTWQAQLFADPKEWCSYDTAPRNSENEGR
jgi:hypothetical protein